MSLQIMNLSNGVSIGPWNTSLDSTTERIELKEEHSGNEKSNDPHNPPNNIKILPKCKKYKQFSDYVTAKLQRNVIQL